MSKSTKTVIVGAIQTKSGETSGRRWRRYALMDDQDHFVGSTFSGTIGKFLQEHEGEAIEVDTESKEGSDGGTLIDLLDARLPSSKAPATPTDGQGAIPTAERNLRHLHIVREVALKAAVDALPYVVGPTLDETKLIGTAGIISIADAFAYWIEHGQDEPTE